MKDCLWCKKQFEEKRESAKFCSTSCRVMHYRKHGKKNQVTPIQMQVLYNAVIGMVEKIKQIPSQEQYDSPKLPDKIIGDEPLSFSKLKQETASNDRYEEFFSALHLAQDLEQLERVGKRIKASGLLWKEKQKLEQEGKQIAKHKFID